MRNKTLLIAAMLVNLASCRAHRQVVDIQANPTRDSSLTDSTGMVSTLKITAVSLPPQAYRYDRLEVTISDQEDSSKKQTQESYKVNAVIPVSAHRDYSLLVRAYQDSTLLYSNEYCKAKKGFRSQLGITLLTVSLCEKPEPGSDEDSDSTPE